MNYRFTILLILITSNIFAANSRTLTINNQCDFDVLWGMTGTPIKNKGTIVECSETNATCFDGNGICASNGICYFKYPQISSGKDSNPDFYLAQGVTKEYTIDLINTYNTALTNVSQYTLNLGAQYQCSYNNRTGLYECLSGMCERDANNPINGQCKLDKGLQTPYTQAEITFNDGQNDFYNISIVKGMNIPISITPIGKYAKQDIPTKLFCKETGSLPTGHPNNMPGCTWKFQPPINEEQNLSPHIFTQIYRDLNSDLIVSCQSDDDCPNGERCGLKFPEDLKNYHLSAYCGIPLGYYTVADICSLGGLSPELQKIFRCQRIMFDESNIEEPVPIAESAPVSERCPDNNVTLSLQGIPNSEIKLCNYELFACNTKAVNIDGKDYKYLDSCYNYDPNEPGSSACCGCVDWPGVPTDENNLCLKSVDQKDPEPCNIDFANLPPDCKANYRTKVSMPNTKWLELVKPYLKWLVDGCPDAYEYKYGNKHSTLQCSNKDMPTETGNNINYLITFCPSGKSLFSNYIKPSETKIVYEDMSLETAQEFKRDHEILNNTDLISILIFVIFSILVVILVILYADKREK